MERLLASWGISAAELPEGYMERAAGYLQRVEEHRDRLDLTSIRDPRRLVGTFLVRPWKILHLLRAWGMTAAKPVYDLGSGGGVPGVGMKLAGLEPRLVLVERSVTKAGFLRELVGVLALPGVQIQNMDGRLLQPEPGAWIVTQGVNLARRPLRRSVERWLRRGVHLAWVTLPRKGGRTRFAGRGPHLVEIPGDPYVLALLNPPIPAE